MMMSNVKEVCKMCLFGLWFALSRIVVGLLLIVLFGAIVIYARYVFAALGIGFLIFLIGFLGDWVIGEYF